MRDDEGMESEPCDAADPPDDDAYYAAELADGPDGIYAMNDPYFAGDEI